MHFNLLNNQLNCLIFFFFFFRNHENGDFFFLLSHETNVVKLTQNAQQLWMTDIYLYIFCLNSISQFKLNNRINNYTVKFKCVKFFEVIHCFNDELLFFKRLFLAV